MESLHNVCNTIMFLYSAGYVGDLCQEGNNYFLNIDKKEFKSQYYKDGKETKSLNRCSTFYLFCDSYHNIFLALSYIMKNGFLNVTAKDYARMQGIFYKLDYRSIFLKESTKREDISPLRMDILNTACSRKAYLKSLVQSILERFPLCARPKFHEYYTPHWILQFYTKQTNKFVFNINVPADTICLEIRLSTETVEKLAEKMEVINGQLEARLLTLYVTSEEDIKSALMLLEMEQEVLDWE